MARRRVYRVLSDGLAVVSAALLVALMAWSSWLFVYKDALIHHSLGTSARVFLVLTFGSCATMGWWMLADCLLTMWKERTRALLPWFVALVFLACPVAWVYYAYVYRPRVKALEGA